MVTKPTTLGDALALVAPRIKVSSAVRRAKNFLVNVILLTVISTLPLWWVLMHPDVGWGLVSLWVGVIVVWVFVSYRQRSCERGKQTGDGGGAFIAGE